MTVLLLAAKRSGTSYMQQSQTAGDITVPQYVISMIFKDCPGLLDPQNLRKNLRTFRDMQESQTSATLI